MQPLDWTDVPPVVAAILVCGGTSGEAAEAVAGHLVDSEIAGRTTHGLRLLPAYLRALADGSVDGRAIPEVLEDDGPVAVVDGHGGFSAPAGDLAVRVGVDRATRHGCATVALRNVHHLGRLGRWSEIAADAGLVSLHFGHGFRSRPSVVPHGGARAALGANPLSIGLPSAGSPLVLDIATAAASAGAVRLAAETGVRLAEPCLIRPDGAATDDPEAFLAGDAGISVFGGHKGFGLSLATEILAGALAAGDRRDVGRDALLSIYIAPQGFCSPATYDGFAEGLARRVRGAGAGTVRLPGDRSAAARRSALAGATRPSAAALEAIREASSLAGADGALAARWPGRFPTGR